MSKKEKVKIETYLPVKKVLIVFFTILIIVAVLAAVAGENQKMRITGRKLMDRVAAREYKDAYNLLTDEAKSRISSEDFQAKLAMLRNYLRLKYGPAFNEEYKYSFEAPFWIPLKDDSRRNLSFGLYKKGGSMESELAQFFITPPLAGEQIKDFITVVREDGAWKIADFNFDPEKYSVKNPQPLTSKYQTLFSPTENGFIIEGFIYDKRVVTPEQRAWMIDALRQALHEMETDAGKKTGGDDLMKFIP